jgi:hypothetical protein
MKKTRIKLSDNEKVSIVIGEDNELLFIDIIDKDDVRELDAEYMQEFGEMKVLPFVMSKDQFDLVIRFGMTPLMEDLIQQMTGVDAKEVMKMSDDELTGTIDAMDKLKFNNDETIN